ncbi:hydroxymethylbilane synthase [Pseudoflavonifractor sp. An85]|uniref:hydroxymethylbilane synthase n=1 Tax=Pseudoflavonifractor sp. An85 TaxID=1965661 RepID=UPI000B3A0EB7|nr:hydroxymethylbilane synthase [Pseudoflavonifractor sp. An85]OUN22409.1 hydroxymethylbilane synthase [Pseudoflavonifractor sp. An85]
MKIRIGSRDSRLAVIQSEMVIDAIRAYNPTADVELVTMKTTGDLILDRPLSQIGGKGLFVKELDRALLEGRVDFTVHSSKDLPMDIPPELPLVAFSHRADPRDALVLPQGVDTLDPEKPIGCASLRRTLQLKKLFPHHPVAPVRGNVQTRLAKLDRGEYSALVLACAGLDRLGLEGRISRRFPVEEMLPAAGQGILAVQSRQGVDTSYLSRFHDPVAAVCLTAERAFVGALEGGCSSPVAAHATVDGDTVTLTGFYVNGEGESYIETSRAACADAREMGAELARRMRRDHP